MTLNDIQKAYKEYLMALPVQKYEGQTINELIYRKQQDGRAVALCLVDGLSILHAQWFYYDQVGNIPTQIYEESFNDLKDLSDRISLPIRIIETGTDDLDIFIKPPEASVTQLIQHFGDQNKQNIMRYSDKIPQTIKNNYEQNYVICQWISGNFTIEKILSIPKFVETFISLQHFIKQDGYVIEKTVSRIFDMLDNKTWSSSLQNTQIKYIKENNNIQDIIKKQKGLIIDCYTLTVGNNENKKRELINYFICNTIKLKEKLLIICKDAWYTQYLVKAVQQHNNSMIFQMHQNKFVQKQIQDGNFSVVLWQTTNDYQNFEQNAAFFSKIKFDTVLLCDHQRILMQYYTFLQADKKIILTTLVQNDQQNTNILTFLNNDLVQFADNHQNLTTLTAFYELGHHFDLNGLQVQQILQPEYLVQSMTINCCEDVENKKEDSLEKKYQNITYATDIKFKHYINQCSGQKFNNHIILTINQLFEEKVRQRMFLDSDMVVQKILNDDKRGCGLVYDSKKQQGGKAGFQLYQAAVTYFFATLLQLQWLTNSDSPQLNKSRTQILKLFLTSLLRLNKRSCLIICPDTVTQPLIQAVKDILDKQRYNIATQLGQQINDDGLNVVVLSESQLQCTYIISACFGRDMIPQSMELPRYIFFPCVNCRSCDVMVDAIYRVHGATEYNFYQVCPLNALEQHLLMYRQKFSFVLLQEQLSFYEAFTNAVQTNKLNEIDLYNQMLTFLKNNGFSGQNTQDFQVFVPEPQTIEDQLKQYLTHPQVQLVMSSHMHTDLVLQAAWNDIFDIDIQKFNMKGFMAETYGRHDSTLNINVQNPIYDSQGLINVDIHTDQSISVDPGVLFYYNIQPNITFDINVSNPKLEGLGQYDDLKLQNYMKTMTLYHHFIQPNQNTSQMNVNEILQKLDSIRDISTPNNQMKQFMQKINSAYDVGKAVKPCHDNPNSTTKKRRPKQIVETPIMCSQTGSHREQAMLFSDYSVSPPKRATVCQSCLQRLTNVDESRQGSQSTDRGLIYGPRCDFCDAVMKESYDLGQVEMLEQYSNQPIISFKSVSPEKDFPRNAYENMTNMALNAFTYFGGQRIDSIYVTPKDILNDNDYKVIYQLLQQPEFAEKPLHTLSAVLGLIKQENPTFPIQIRRDVRITDQLESRQLKWLQIYMDWVIRNGYDQNQAFNNTQILCDNICFERLIQFAVPYDLFDAFVGQQGMNYNVIQTTITAQSLQQYTVKYMHQHLQQLQAQKYTEGFDYLQFIYQWYLHHPKQSPSQRYGPLGQGQFFKELLFALNTFPQLRNSSIFNGCVVSNDSYIILALLSNITALGSGFQGLKIVPQTLKMQKQVQYQPFQIIRAYRYHCRNASIHTALYYLFQNEQQQQEFVQEYKKLQSDDQRYFVEQVLKIKFSPIQVLTGPLDLTQQTPQSISKGDIPIPDKKQIQYIFDQIKHLNVIKLHLHAVSGQNHQAQMQQYQQQQQQQVQQPQTNQVHQSQISNSNSMMNTSQIQAPSYNTNISIVQGQGRQQSHPQTISGMYQPPQQPIQTYNQVGTIHTPITKTNTFPSVQTYNNPLRGISNQPMQNDAIQFNPSNTVIPPFSTSGHESKQFNQQRQVIQNYSTTVHTRGYLLDQLIEMHHKFEQARVHPRRPVLNDIIKRIMRDHSLRYYLMKENILYIPDVKITDRPAEHYSTQLGYIPQQLQREKIDINCRFEDYIAQLCDEYLKNNNQQNQVWYKFLTLTEQKQKIIEQMAERPIQLKQFKTLSKCQEWVLKHCLLPDCDVLQKKIIYFAQDPVTGIDLDNDDLYTNSMDKYNSQIDKIFKLTDDQQKNMYDRLGTYILKQPNHDEVITMVAEYSFGMGSGPSQMFHQLQKFYQLDPQSMELAVAVIQLMNLCYISSVQFPFPILGKKDPQYFIEVYDHMIIMRLIQLKLQQIDYFVWLSRVQRNGKEEKDQQTIQLVQEHINESSMPLKNDPRIKELQNKCNPNDNDQLNMLLKLHQDAESLNKQISQVDTLFVQFINQQHEHYQRHKQYPVPCFGVNDANQTKLKQVWECAACYKIAFITVFGHKYAVLEAYINEMARTGNGPIKSQEDANQALKIIRELYISILDLWSRFHDYLLLFVQSDLGKSGNLFQILAEKYDQKYTESRFQKKISLLKSAVLAQDIQQVRQFFLVDLIKEDAAENKPSEQGGAYAQFKYFYNMLEIGKVPDVGYSPDQQRLNDANIRMINAFLHNLKIVFNKFPRNYANVQQISERLGLLKHALKCEWKLIAKPLEIAQQSKKLPVSNGSYNIPQMSPPSDLQLPTLPRQTDQFQPNIAANLPVIPLNIPPQVMNATQPIQFQNQRSGSPLELLRLHEPSVPASTGSQSQNDGNQSTRYKIQFNHAPQEGKLNQIQIQMINEKPLSFYKAPKHEVLEFVKDVLRRGDNNVASGLDTEDDIVRFLFSVASCQRQHTDDWGRLFSYVIDTLPEPVEQSNEKAKKTHDAISLLIQRHCGVSLDGPRLFERVTEVQSSLPAVEQEELRTLVRSYVRHNLDIGYYNTFRFRDEVGRQPETAMNQYKIGIYGALRQMQVLHGRPLNALTEENDSDVKKKMGLCTYFFLAHKTK